MKTLARMLRTRLLGSQPVLSIVVVVFNMAREAKRTLHSLSASYQIGVSESEYEIVVVDNGSTPPFGPPDGSPRNARYFHIADASGVEVARITKKWAGMLLEGFTTADNYVFTVEPTVQGPLRMLCFAAAAAVDLALKQNG